MPRFFPTVDLAPADKSVAVKNTQSGVSGKKIGQPEKSTFSGKVECHCSLQQTNLPNRNKKYFYWWFVFRKTLARALRRKSVFGSDNEFGQ